MSDDFRPPVETDPDVAAAFEEAESRFSGGHPENLSPRAAVRHGAAALVSTGQLAPEFQMFAEELETYRAEGLAWIGGEAATFLDKQLVEEYARWAMATSLLWACWSSRGVQALTRRGGRPLLEQVERASTRAAALRRELRERKREKQAIDLPRVLSGLDRR